MIPSHGNSPLIFLIDMVGMVGGRFSSINMVN